MPKKKWTDMEIIRVKLNPEQAVLQCCYLNVVPQKYRYYTASGFICGGVGASPLCKERPGAASLAPS